MKDTSFNIIDAYNNLLYEIYDREGLVCLSDNSYVYKGHNILALNTARERIAKTDFYKYLLKVTDSLKKPTFIDTHVEGEII